jgi:DNA-binding transcriptional LysR family regulator
VSQKYFERYQKEYGKPIVPKLVVASWQVIMDLALSGYGAAFVPRFLCEKELKSKKLEIVKHRIKPVPLDLCAIVSRDRAFPKNAQALFECFGREI